ncbi:DHA2 family efflux MFS transporter permease subunit [Planctomonas sp. JC2975]|uniref:DHA2 family efflux MFS transporter permease subunit n=1 Tax=Planctomonas sp. JC2975 TaxID=2729626 RepID=UPI001475E216|nr:DHA2 family efflux MFS transporter permease subunit [Planctomonas sp. JC2975]NNC12241.1 DHA2 family efflux MFS transporter permease subunit [Planctomonas sp. JC2975]
MDKQRSPWPALWALVIGFFMILVDTTIVSVANPKIMVGLKTDINSVIWVTSAYLLAYAVPLLVTGRLGDRFGPKNMYLIGLVLFTGASLWCGLSGTIEMLITARVVQGLGAALMTPQTMAVITRTFPPNKRGGAMALWGATSGVAMLVGPLLGGVLVDGLGWEWIFFINVPVGVVAFILAMILVPKLPTHQHSFDILGVVLSAVGLFLVVFGIQEGETYDWGTITGPITVWGMIIAGIVVLAAFVVWQAVNKGEPLMPLKLFRDRNFSLASFAISTVGFTVSSMSLPLIFFAQLVLGFTPTQSALLMVPMALVVLPLSPVVGRLVDRMHPRYLAFFGLFVMVIGLLWYSAWLDPNVDLWPRLLLPSVVLGVANAFIWAPLSVTATHNLPTSQAGAGAGIYNTVRQIGSVLGSAAIAALLQARLTANGLHASANGAQFGGGKLPAVVAQPFTDAMAQTMLLPAAAALIGAVVVLFFVRPRDTGQWSATQGTPVVNQAPEPVES